MTPFAIFLVLGLVAVVCPDAWAGRYRRRGGKITRKLRDYYEITTRSRETAVMHAERQLTFESYRLDLTNEQLWCGSQEIPLPGKALAVLRYLVEHAGQLVTKAELFAALWPDTVVSDGALTFCIVELRKALGDNAKTPRFIETVHRRGYRFLPATTTAPLQGSGIGGPGSVGELRNKAELLPDHVLSAPNPVPRPPAPVLVGREPDLAQLQQRFAKALLTVLDH